MDTVGDSSYTVTVDGAGVAQLTVMPPPRRKWLVTQVSVEMPAAPIGATCDIRKNGALVTPLIPTGDAASGEPPVLLRPNDQMAITFQGCTPGDVGSAWLSYTESPA